MKRRVRTTVVFVIAAIGIASVVGIGTVVASADDVAATEVVSALEAPSSVLDALPKGLNASDIGQGGLVVGSQRYLGADGKRSYWVASDVQGEICLIVALGDSGGTVASACNDAGSVSRNGLMLGAHGRDQPTYVSYLLPDSIEDQGRAPSGWTLVGDNVVVALADELAHDVEVETADGRIILSR